MKIKKISKIMLVTIFIAMLMTTISINKTFATTTVANGKCGENITWTLDSTGMLTLDGSGRPYSNITESPWKDHQNQVKNVTIKGSFSEIPAFAFYQNKNISSITMPNNITSIGKNAFEGCSNLKNVKLPNYLSLIKEESYKDCTSLQNIEIPRDVLYIYKDAFNGCISLKTITIKSIVTSINDSINTLGPASATICGYKKSSAVVYARYNGRPFKDLETGKTTTEKITIQTYIDALPTKNVQALGITSHGSFSLSGDKFRGYSANFCNEKDTTNATYKQIKSDLDNTIQNCHTQREKASAIISFIVKKIDYTYTSAVADINVIYSLYNKAKGNCEVYTMLASYMFYLAGIPTATVTDVGHEWMVAYFQDEGKWVYIEPQAGIGNLANHRANTISFAYEGLIYTIDDPITGPYITGIAKTKEEISKLTSYTIPDSKYAKGIYYSAFPKDIELKATIGSIGEQYIKENCESYYISGNQIISGQKPTTIPEKTDDNDNKDNQENKPNNNSDTTSENKNQIVEINGVKAKFEQTNQNTKVSIILPNNVELTDKKLTKDNLTKLLESKFQKGIVKSIKNSSGKVVSKNNEEVGTNSIIELTTGQKITVVLYGDVNCDGYVDIVDALTMAYHENYLDVITDKNILKAGNIVEKGSDEVTIIDALRIAYYDNAMIGVDIKNAGTVLVDESIFM